MSLLCFIFLSSFTSILCVLETGFVVRVFIYVSFFLPVPFITSLLFSAVTSAIAVSTHLLRLHQLWLRLHLLRLHQLRLRLHLLRPHLLRLWLHRYGYGYQFHLLRLHLLRLRLCTPAPVAALPATALPAPAAAPSVVGCFTRGVRAGAAICQISNFRQSNLIFSMFPAVYV